MMFYVLLLGVVYLAKFDFTMEPTKVQHQILCKSRKIASETLAMIRQAIGEESMCVCMCLNGKLGLGKTEKGETGEEQS
jgi:hypothetical protein